MDDSTEVTTMGDTFRIVNTAGTAVANVTPFYFSTDLSVSNGTGEEMTEATGERAWEGVLGVIGHPTSDGRYLMPDQIGERELPLPLNVQIVTAEGHDNSHNAGRIEEILYVPAGEFDPHEFATLQDVPDDATVIWGRGVLDDSPAADEAERLIGNGYGVSMDLPYDRIAAIDRETLEEVAEEDVDHSDLGRYLTGISGKIAGATIGNVPAFEEASVSLVDGVALVASAFGMRVVKTIEDQNDESLAIMNAMIGPGNQALVAAAAPLKPPRAWFDDPGLQKLTPLTITKEGRIFGHLCDWDGCHTGFGSICVPPFRSLSNYKYFNIAPVETAEGDDILTGKLMFSRDGAGHAPTDLWTTAEDAAKHYDNATKEAGYVRAGEDRFGTWLAGSLVPGLSEEDVLYIKAHPPSGDWRPSPKWAGSELLAAFCVSVPGFPIAQSLVASGVNGELTIITAPLDMEMGPRAQIRQRQMLKARLREALSR